MRSKPSQNQARPCSCDPRSACDPEDNRSRSSKRSKPPFARARACAAWRSSLSAPEPTARTSLQQCGRTFEPIRPVLFPSTSARCLSECKGSAYSPLRSRPRHSDHTKSLAQAAIEPWSKPSCDWWQKQMLLSMKRAWGQPPTSYKICRRISTDLWKGEARWRAYTFSKLGRKLYKLHVRDAHRYRHGSRPTVRDSTRPDACYVKIAGRDIHELSALKIEEAALDHILALSPYEEQISRDILRQLTANLGFLLGGLSYLTLSLRPARFGRRGATRSLGQSTRCPPVGPPTVLDEPTIVSTR